MITNYNPKFALDVHRALTEKATSNVLKKDLVPKVILANLAQDLRQFESKVHFDNCAFEDGAAYIAEEWKIIESSTNKLCDFALSGLGRLLHTTQDFYSHSNWVELFQNESPLPLWSFRIMDLPTGIVSGVWMYGEPKKCKEAAPSHDELNKDNPASKEGGRQVSIGPNTGKTLHQLAYDSAFRASREQLARFVGKAARDLPMVGEVSNEASAQALEAIIAVLDSTLNGAKELRSQLD